MKEIKRKIAQGKFQMSRAGSLDILGRKEKEKENRKMEEGKEEKLEREKESGSLVSEQKTREKKKVEK